MKTQLTHFQQRIEQQLKQTFSQCQAPAPLQEAMQYATLNPGKRLRPALVYATAQALQCPLEKVDTAAQAIELIHSYSLVHDDLPAMDDDDLRRGQPTCHIQFDEATAILVGDAQQTLAFEVLSQSAENTAEEKIRQIQILTHASGAEGMVAGQIMDIQSENRSIDLNTLQTLHQLKTGKLIQAALLLGASTHERYAELSPALKTLGQNIGLAFQVQDDILDIEASSDELGKPQGSDLAANKSTYPKLLGLIQAKTYRDQLIEQAHQQLATLPLQSPFLTQLIDYIAQRRH